MAYDLRKQAVYYGWHGSSMSVELLNVPETDGDLGDPEWEKVDILEIGELWNILEDAIEERWKIEDAERRRVVRRNASFASAPAARSAPLIGSISETGDVGGASPIARQLPKILLHT